MEARTDDPTIIATAELPRIGRTDEPRHLYVHADGTLELEIDSENFEDVVGSQAYENYLGFIAARRGWRFARLEDMRAEPNVFQKFLGKLGLGRS